MSNTMLLHDAALIRIKLHNKFYNCPDVIQNITDYIKGNDNQVSTVNYVQSNNSIQIHLKKSCIKKIDSYDSFNYYGLFSEMLRQLFYLYKNKIVHILDENQCEQPDEIFNKLINYTDMLYSITKVSNNIIIIYL